MSVPELDQYRQQFEQVKVAAQELARGLTEEKFNWRPAPDQWSIEECLSHLVMVSQCQVKSIERAIDDAEARGIKGSGPFRYGWFDRWIVRISEPPVRRKVRAPRRFRPLHGQPVTAVLPTFLHIQDQLILQIARSEGLDLARVKVNTPISRLVRMSLGMMFAHAAAHQRRHLLQARNVRERLPR